MCTFGGAYETRKRTLFFTMVTMTVREFLTFLTSTFGGAAQTFGTAFLRCIDTQGALIVPRRFGGVSSVWAHQVSQDFSSFASALTGGEAAGIQPHTNTRDSSHTHTLMPSFLCECRRVAYDPHRGRAKTGIGQSLSRALRALHIA